MIGRETWRTANKRLPGIYIRIFRNDMITSEDIETIPETNSTLLVDLNGVILRTADGYYLVVQDTKE